MKDETVRLILHPSSFILPMNRRDFLRSRRLAQTAGHVLGALHELETSAPPAAEIPDEIAVLRLGRRAMATTFEVVLPFGTPNATEAAGEAFELLDRLEDQLTVYRETSEVSRLNALAWRKAVRVESGLFGLLRLAAQVHAETGGAYDVTAGALIKAWGFFRGPRRVPPEPERRAALARVGMDQVELLPEGRRVRYRRAGLEVNLGSIGKGYALDRMAGLLAGRWKIPAALLHGGHSSLYAKGDPLGEGRGWAVTVRHPWEPGRPLARVWLRDRALGTSAATFQYLEHEGRKFGHILDPRTGWPAGGMASASVLAPTAAEADALSTAFFVGGLETARRYCERHPGVGAVLLPEGEGERPVVVGLGADEVTLFEDAAS
jgi:thiamine biosynthesis lipoprotein